MKWNGQAWSAVGLKFNAPVGALVCRGAKVYAGGAFSDIGSSGVNFVAQLESGSWSPLGVGRPGCGANAYVDALVVDKAGNVYVDGLLKNAGGVSNTDQGVLRWDGKTWTAIGLPGTVYSFAVDSANRVYAGGSIVQGLYRVARWDGVSWSYLPGSFDYAITSLAIDATGNLYAGGDFSQVDGKTINRIAKWNGSSWSSLGTGILGSVYALASDPAGNLYVGGYFSSAGGVSAQNIARWNGSSWSALDSGIDGFLSALACDSAGGLYAGGGFSSAGGLDVSGIARWDGTSWSGLGGGVRLEGASGSVEALTFDSAGNLYVTGVFDQAGLVPAKNIAKWNGTSWSSLGSGLGGAGFALACSSEGHLYVGGDFVEAGGKSSSFIAEWSQSSPTVMPLNLARFKAEIVWRASGVSGAAQPVSLSSDSGFFWFFGPTNLEILVKVLDGRGVNGCFWVFFGALTDVQFDLVITDTATGAVRTYSNPAGVQAGKNDTTAFSDSASTPASAPDLDQETRAFDLVLELVRREGFASPLSLAPASVLQVHNGRFTIDVEWITPNGATGSATGVPLTSDSGYFWFFEPGNIELAAKVLDARGVNGHFWFFYGALTDLNYNIRVTDTLTGTVKLYQGEQGKQKSGRDLAAF
ncbi:MAG: hypothetical protein EHM61_07750 [Acidobacteria bacterium]|nr:MAG: hypothetical protein EHM61_07750 [Acidobacteriota bacterium]